MLGTTSDDLVSEHRRVFEPLGLPTRVEGVSWSEVRERMELDKKYSRGLRLVLLRKIGDPVVERVPVKVLERAFREVAG